MNPAGGGGGGFSFLAGLSKAKLSKCWTFMVVIFILVAAGTKMAILSKKLTSLKDGSLGYLYH